MRPPLGRCHYALSTGSAGLDIERRIKAQRKQGDFPNIGVVVYIKDAHRHQAALFNDKRSTMIAKSFKLA